MKNLARKPRKKSWINTPIRTESAFLHFFMCFFFIRKSEFFFKNTRNSRKFRGCFQIKIEILFPKSFKPILRVENTTRSILLDSIKCFWISWIGEISRYGRYPVALSVMIGHLSYILCMFSNLWLVYNDATDLHNQGELERHHDMWR